MAGCVAPGAGPDPARAPILAGAMMLAAPDGYCIVPGSRLERGDDALALMGRCAGEDSRPPAVLTVTLGARGSASGFDSNALATWLRGAQGRAALSRRGRAADVTVEEVVGLKSALLIRLRDAGADRAVEPAAWRAVLPLRERLVTLTVTGPRETPLAAAAGRKLMEGFIARMRAANP
ncbi:MAG: cation transport ATPase [Gemmobacter sp.]|nr:cation transport ATPase [Gemmobacter sp.]